jgi:hypothetical protein
LLFRSMLIVRFFSAAPRVVSIRGWRDGKIQLAAAIGGSQRKACVVAAVERGDFQFRERVSNRESCAA